MYFVWISEQTAIISLYNINLLVLVTEKESVYCAVRTRRFIYYFHGATAPVGQSLLNVKASRSHPDTYTHIR